MQFFRNHLFFVIQINFVQELLVKYIIKGTLLYFIYYIYYIIYYNTAQICKLIKTDLYYSMEFLQEYWPQLGALLALIVVFTTMKVDISVLKEKVKTLFSLINKDK